MPVRFEYTVPKEHEKYTALSSISFNIESDEYTLTQMFEAYKQFLAAIGFTIDGEIVLQRTGDGPGTSGYKDIDDDVEDFV